MPRDDCYSCGPVPSKARGRLRALVQRPAEPKFVVTRRQVQILKLAANGCTNRAIANRMGISEDTVKSQLKAIYPKLRVSDRTQAVAVALALGLLSLDDIAVPVGIRLPTAH